jgi:hypothetical protein
MLPRAPNNPLNVRFALEATELLRRHKMTRCANSDQTQCSKKSLLNHLVGGEWHRRYVERDSRKNCDRTH